MHQSLRTRLFLNGLIILLLGMGLAGLLLLARIREAISGNPDGEPAGTGQI